MAPRKNLIPGETGLIVKGDDGVALRSALETLLDDPGRLRQMGRAARRYMENRSFERAFDETWSMYERVDAPRNYPLAKAS